MKDILLPIFCDVDEFCQGLESYCQTYLLSEESKKSSFFPCTTMSLSEVMTIAISFHLSNFRNFKAYYLGYVCCHLDKEFPKRLSYNRFVEVMQIALVPLLMYTLKHRVGSCSGISFVDSTSLKVCHTRRISSHKVFDGIAQRGKTSTGWFYGFKLHLTINDRGEILSFCLTPANVDDRNPNVIHTLTKKLFGKLFGDRGYLSHKLWEQLLNETSHSSRKYEKT